MVDANAAGEVPELRDFAMVLMDLPQAQLDATLRLNEVIQAVIATQKAGAVQLTFNISVGKLDSSTLEITPVVKVSIPKHALKGAVFYPDDAGNPQKDDPSQLWRGDNIRDAPTFTDETKPKEAPAV